MKRGFLVLFVLLFSLNLGFAFDVLDSDGESRVYFSLLNHDLKVVTFDNVSNLSIEKVGVNSSKKFYNFSSCDSKFCSEFSLISYISSASLTLESSQFTISIGNETKDVYLDTIDPEISVQSYLVDNSTKELKIYLSYSDIFQVDKIRAYRVDGSNLVSLGNVTSNLFVYNSTQEGVVTLKFVIDDVAGNSKEIAEAFTIPDLFAPKIEKTFIVKKGEVYKLYFDASDSSLDNYEVIQNQVKLTEDISGISVSKEVTIPFTSGVINFNVSDSLGNYVVKNIDLDASIVNTYQNKYSNEKEFGFTSTANECEIVSIDGTSKSIKMIKTGSYFSTDLDIDTVKEYNIEFFCEDNSFREFYSRSFYYDTNRPEKTKVDVTAEDDGDVKVSWEEALDVESSVSYILYRDLDRIYSGSKESFIDDDVSYPNEYSYYVDVIDEAGNSRESESVVIVPKKTEVFLKTSASFKSETELEKFKFRINSEEGAGIDLVVKSLNSITYQSSYVGKSNDVEIDLSPGVNEFNLVAEDSLGNTKSLTFFVTYNEPIINAKVSPNVQGANVLSENVSEVTQSGIGDGNLVKKNEITPQVESDLVQDEGVVVDESQGEFNLTFILWSLFWLFILGIFVWFFIFNESKLRVAMSKGKTRGLIHDLKRKDDDVLGRSLDKVRAHRVAKVREIEAEVKRVEMRKQRAKKLTNTEKQKLSDLGARKEKFDFSINQSSREKVKKKKVDSINKMKKNEERNSFLKSFLMMFKKENRTVEEKDEFKEYLVNQRKSKSWDSTRVYRQSHHDKIAAKKAAKQKEIDDKKKEQLMAEKDREEEVRKKAEKKAKLDAEKTAYKNANKSAMSGMDEYLQKRGKKRRRFFTEKAVERDLKSREE